MTPAPHIDPGIGTARVPGHLDSCFLGPAIVVEPIAIARLVRDGDEAEVAFAVADEYQSRGIGSALTAQLVADARASGITKITALIASDNPAAISVVRGAATVLSASYEGSDLFIEAALAA